MTTTVPWINKLLDKKLFICMYDDLTINFAFRSSFYQVCFYQQEKLILINILQVAEGGEVDVNEIYQRLTLDTIG